MNVKIFLKKLISGVSFCLGFAGPNMSSRRSSKSSLMVFFLELPDFSPFDGSFCVSGFAIEGFGGAVVDDVAELEEALADADADADAEAEDLVADVSLISKKLKRIVMSH